MPKKTTVVKTYGRHKYRTVRAQVWLSPDEDFRSPYGGASRFPSKIESDSSAKIFKPKSSNWCKPLKKVPPSQVSSHNQKHETSFKNQEKTCLFDISDKENSEPNSSERKLKRKRQTLFSNCTPISAVKSTRHSRLDNSRNLRVKQNEVVLVNDTFESKDESNSHVHELICIEDSQENISPSNRSKKVLDPENSTSGSPSPCVNLDENAVLHFSASSFKDSKVYGIQNDDCHSNSKINMTSSKVDSGFDRCHSSYVTSTPVFDIDTSPKIRGSCKSDSQSSLLMEGKVVLEPLRITPIQWKNLMSSLTEKPHSQHSIQSLPDENTNSTKCSSTSTNVKTSMDLKDCVVSLEKLRITPLKNRSKYLMATMSGDGCLSYKGKSQLSFVEALTPVKKSQSKLCVSTEEKEELQLSAFDKVMLECDQEEPIKFDEFLNTSLLESCVKIGEGVYGEVFRAQYDNGQSIALKIIPIAGDFEVNGEPQKSFEEILPEIVISKELSLLGEVNNNDKPMDNISTSFITVHRSTSGGSPLRPVALINLQGTKKLVSDSPGLVDVAVGLVDFTLNFPESVTCCRDKYPSHLLSEWDRWNEANTSENDRPDIFPDDQYFIVFEFSNGGRDLESFEFSALSEAWSVLHQTALGLAVAENALEFEHRDLHWGNVLISRTGDESIESTLLGENKTVECHGVRVSLIDFTLSRLKKDGVTVFCNLAEDESLFTGKGDYQFDVYRLMKKANENDWEPFEPQTNAFWLHYLADKMLKKKKYPAKDKEIETKLKRFLRQARKCSSATEIVQDFFD